MTANATTKHFLDTSVARSWLLGVEVQQDYFDDEFAGDHCYVSNFVRMEFLRSYILSVIGFCGVLGNPRIGSVDDAIAYWTNKYATSEPKAMLQLVADLIRTRSLDFANARDKQAAIRRIAEYVERIMLKFDFKFKNVGKDSTGCARGSALLDVNPAEPLESLTHFADRFHDTEVCRAKCRIAEFVQQRYRKEVIRYLQQAADVNRSRKTQGFLDVTKKLKEVLNAGAEAGTCRDCKAIGDAVIALDAPRDMRLEHTDYSFDYLCDVIHQLHKLHPSASALLKRHAAR